MTRALRIKIDHPNAPKFARESPREHFWNTLAIRAGEKSEASGKEAEAFDFDPSFWAEAKQAAEYRRGLKESPPDPRYGIREYWDLETKIVVSFPHALRDILFDKLTNQSLVHEFYIKFGCVSLNYNSLEVLMAALGIEKSAAIYGLAMPAIISIIEASVPDALRQTLRLPRGIDFDVTISDEDALASPPTEPPQPEASPSRVAMAARALSLLNVSYLGPILLGIAVLYFAASGAQDAMKEASTERLTLMQGYADLTKQQLIALSDERKEMAKAAQEVTKAVGLERAALAQVYSDLIKQQVTVPGDERKELQKLQQAIEAIRTSSPISRITSERKTTSLDNLHFCILSVCGHARGCR
jgi:hypothetical protein